MNSKDAFKIEEDKIRSQEPELLIKHTAEMQGRDMICGRKLSPADKMPVQSCTLPLCTGKPLRRLGADGPAALT